MVKYDGKEMVIVAVFMAIIGIFVGVVIVVTSGSAPSSLDECYANTFIEYTKADAKQYECIKEALPDNQAAMLCYAMHNDIKYNILEEMIERC